MTTADDVPVVDGVNRKAGIGIEVTGAIKLFDPLTPNDNLVSRYYGHCGVVNFRSSI